VQLVPHGDGVFAVALPRPLFCELLSSCAAQHNYRISPGSDELKVACG
jgi:hypothetical protein